MVISYCPSFTSQQPRGWSTAPRMWKNWLTLSASELPETAFARTKAARTKRDWEERSPGSPSAPMPLLYVCNGSLSEKLFLLLSFGGDMTTWVKPFFYRGRSFFEMFAATGNLPDGVTGATPLASGDAGLLDLFLGNVGGSLGETSALALLIGGVFLLVLGLISWHTPVAYLGGLAVLELFYTLATGGEMTDVLYALLSGGVILGAFFMATDYVTTPMTGAGKLIFGLGCAVLTFVIREFANMPEGCSFSILLMNLLTPYIDKLTMTHPFGAKPAVKKEAK